MKKIFVIGLAIVMCLSMNLTAFAATGGFINSPTKNNAPVVVEVKPESAENEELIITVTPYSKRDTLVTETKENLVEAYEDILAVEDIANLVPALDAIAAEKNLKTENLGVSDLFDISANMELKGNVTIKLKAETAKHFVALIHYHDDVWKVVDSATVRGDILNFNVNDLSPFAIVVDREKSITNAPLTGTDGVIGAIAAMTLISALAIVFAAKKVNS